MKTKDLVICSLFAAITSVLAQISVPLPGSVPLTLQLLSIFICGIVLGSKRGFISILVYLILGAIGLPVYAGFSGGFQCITGPTGGFLISFPIVAFIVGFVSERTDNFILIFLSTLLGLLTSLTIGTLVFAYITTSSITASLTACVMPFILGDLLKGLLATVIGIKLKQNISIKEALNY